VRCTALNKAWLLRSSLAKAPCGRLGTRAYLAGCSAGLGSVKTRFASEALSNLASPGSATPGILAAMLSLKKNINIIDI